jgi:hypothetical protein
MERSAFVVFRDDNSDNKINSKSIDLRKRDSTSNNRNDFDSSFYNTQLLFPLRHKIYQLLQ